MCSLLGNQECLLIEVEGSTLQLLLSPIPNCDLWRPHLRTWLDPLDSSVVSAHQTQLHAEDANSHWMPLA